MEMVWMSGVILLHYGLKNILGGFPNLKYLFILYGKHTENR
eukprot:UN08049